MPQLFLTVLASKVPNRRHLYTYSARNATHYESLILGIGILEPTGIFSIEGRLFLFDQRKIFSAQYKSFNLKHRNVKSEDTQRPIFATGQRKELEYH